MKLQEPKDFSILSLINTTVSGRKASLLKLLSVGPYGDYVLEMQQKLRYKLRLFNI